MRGRPRWPFRSHRTQAQVAEHRALLSKPRARRTRHEQMRVEHLRHRAYTANKGRVNR